MHVRAPGADAHTKVSWAYYNYITQCNTHWNVIIKLFMWTTDRWDNSKPPVINLELRT